MLRLAVAAILLFSPTLPARAQAPGAPRAGDRYEIRVQRESSDSSTDGSSSSASSRTMLVERVIAVRDTGVELEFDAPPEASAEDRAANWQLPVRVLRPAHGPLALLNGPELEARVDGWLRSAGWTRAACGQWIFTWNAFQIQCDPQSAIEMLAPFDLRPDDLREGAPYRETGALGEAVLRPGPPGRDGVTLVVEMQVDPEAVRLERARADVVVALIGSGETVALEAALQVRAGERISGTVTISFEADSEGRVWRRTRVTRLAIEEPGGTRETRTITETLERRLVSRAEP